MPTHVFIAAKGGQGTTVTAAATALMSARSGQRTLLIDAADRNDCHAVLGLPELSAPESLIEVTPGLDLTCAESDGTRVDLSGYDTVIVDAGQRGVRTTDAETVTLVTRNCYLALRRALAIPSIATSVVVVEEPERALGAADVASVLGLDIVAAVRLDPAVARAVDAGLLVARLPDSLERVVDAIQTAVA